MPGPVHHDEPVLPGGPPEESPIEQYRRRHGEGEDDYEKYAEVPDDALEQPEKQGE